MEITALGNHRIKEVVKLSKNKKFRQEKGLLYFEGEFFLEFIDEIKDLIDSVYTTNYEYYSEDHDVIHVPKEVFKKISKLDYDYGYVFIAEVPKLATEVTNDKVLYLENINDPGNLGTILRTALAFNFGSVLLSEGCVDVFNEKVIRASKGTVFKLNIMNNVNLETISDLADKGYKVIATGLDGESLTPQTNDKMVVMFGSEGNGLSNEALVLANEVVKININKDVESLNVAIAAGIILHNFQD